MLTPGVRVIRGFDWVWGEQDGGAGGAGTVSEIGLPGSKRSPDKTVVVNWDNGIRSNYRVGYQGLYDLILFDNAQCGVKHINIECDSCKQKAIVGIRYKCSVCYDFDMCSLCYHGDKHDLKHPSIRYSTAVSIGVKLSPRSGESKLTIKGLFTGAVVQRGHDWKWANQDGGEGNTGVITDICNWGNESKRSVACVTWNNGYKNDYRVGHKGIMDLKCVKPGIAGSYYVNHLPVLGMKEPTNELEGASPVNVICKFNQGDKVKVLLDVDTLKSLQQGHGGWNPRMVEYIGKIGIVHRITERGDVRVQYEDCPNRWTFHPGALEWAGSSWQRDDMVCIVKDFDGREQLNGKVGKVVSIFPDGKLRVILLDDQSLWTVTPNNLKLLKREDTNYQNSGIVEQPNTEDNASNQPELRLLMSKVAQGNVEYVKEVRERIPKLLDMPYCGKTAVQVAAYQGHSAVLKELLASGARPHSTDDDGDTALHDAAFGNQPEILEILLSHPDVDINTPNRSKCTALHIAAHKCLPHCVDVLLKHNPNVNVQDAYGDTVFHDAVNAVCESREPPTSALLELEDNVPVSPSQRIIKMLADRPEIDLSIRNKRGFNALQHASLKGAWYACECICRRAPELVDVKKDDGFAPLHLASLNGHRYAVEALVRVGKADINLRNNRGQTPLLLAISQGHTVVVESLVNLGCDVTLWDEDGNSALHIVVLKRLNIQINVQGQGTKFGPKSCPAIFRIYNKLQEQNNFGNNCLLVAVLLYLISKGCNPEHLNKDGKTYSDLLENSELVKLINEKMSSVIAYARRIGHQKTSHEDHLPEINLEDNIAEISIEDTSPNISLEERRQIMDRLEMSIRNRYDFDKERLTYLRPNRLGQSSSNNSPAHTRGRPLPPIPKSPDKFCDKDVKSAECMVCCELSNENCTFEPCGHKIACEDCATRMKKCLSCFTLVERRLTNDGRILACQTRQPSAERLRYLESKIQEIEETHCCSICMERRRSVAFLCGHTACTKCADTLTTCHMCRKPITNKINLY